jgi:hypothetical protein
MRCRLRRGRLGGGDALEKPVPAGWVKPGGERFDLVGGFAGGFVGSCVVACSGERRRERPRGAPARRGVSEPLGVRDSATEHLDRLF